MLKSAASSKNSSVTGWATAENYSSLNLKTGDCIEFLRDTYCHWAMYIGDQNVIHFNPSNSSEKVGLLQMERFLLGSVTIALLKTVAGNSKFRVNNMTGNSEPPRPLKHIQWFFNILVNKPGFYYCLGRFNCEHFVTFLKFGDSKSLQMDIVDAIKSSLLSIPMILSAAKSPSISKSLSDAEFYRELALLQWNENAKAASENRTPKFFMQEAIEERQRNGTLSSDFFNKALKN